MKHYIIQVYGCVEPSIVFKSANAGRRDRYARAFRNSNHFKEESDALFWLDIDGKGKPQIGSFSAEFMEEEEDDIVIGEHGYYSNTEAGN